VLGIGANERDRERPTLRLRERCGDLGERCVEQVAERAKRELRFRLRRGASEDPRAVARRLLERAAPEYSLPDSRIAFEQEGAVGGVEEVRDRGELLLPPDQV
jgi:hypothetical protein